MHYDCRVERGEARLKRMPERSYRVVGRRDQQTLRVCSPLGTSRCRNIELHRFSFDCNGTLVAWMDAADAAVLGQPWRSTVGGGRMTLRFWPGGPIRDRQPPIALPPGFAPTPSSGLRFAPAAPPAPPDARDSERPGRSRGTSIVSKAVVSDPGELLQPITARDTQAGDDATPPATEASADSREPASMPPSSPLMGQGWTATVTYGGGDSTSPPWDVLARGGSNALLAALGLAALVLSATLVAARQRSGGSKPTVATSVAASAQAPAAGAVARSGVEAPREPPPPPPRTARQAATNSDPPCLVGSEARPPPVPAAVPSDWDAVVELRTTAGALLGIVRQIIADHVPDGALREVLVADLGTIAERLDGPELATALAEGRLDLVHPVYAQAILDLERVRTLARIEHQRIVEVAEPSRLPSTFDEACEFLGVNPRASLSVVKKVVDALRQNWHPDLAGDEPDRAAREERIKRINAAWDLIRAR